MIFSQEKNHHSCDVKTIEWPIINLEEKGKIDGLNSKVPHHFSCPSSIHSQLPFYIPTSWTLLFIN
jgi:hypothetical protein